MSMFTTSVVYHTTKLQPQTSRLLQRDMFAQNPSDCRNNVPHRNHKIHISVFHFSDGVMVGRVLM
jgi:hypothetical protein